MTDEERRAKLREYKQRYNEKQRQRMTDDEIKAQQREYKRRYREKHPDRYRAAMRRKWERTNTPEFRAKRRAKYAEAHKDDPMTEHRRKILEANAKRAQGLPTHEVKVYETRYEEYERNRERKHQKLVSEIQKWANRTRHIRNMHICDIAYYERKAQTYCKLQEQYKTVAINEQNAIALSMRTIEQQFEELYKQQNITPWSKKKK